MKTNAITAAPVRLYQVWGDIAHPWEIQLPAGEKVFVLYSPIHNRFIMSLTYPDHRYDAFVDERHFILDPTLLVRPGEDDGPGYYLNRQRSGNEGVA